MRTWSVADVIDEATVAFIRTHSLGAVAFQGILDMFSTRPPFANDHPIPGCPNPSGCRTYGCAGDCSEAIEAPLAVSADARDSGGAVSGQPPEPPASPRPKASAEHPDAGPAADRPAADSDILPSPAAGHLNLDRKHETPWHVEDFIRIPWLSELDMRYGISDRWHCVIAHFDSRDVAQIVVDVINAADAPAEMETGQDMGGSAHHSGIDWAASTFPQHQK